jgi:hypothetical protein
MQMSEIMGAHALVVGSIALILAVDESASNSLSVVSCYYFHEKFLLK